MTAVTLVTFVAMHDVHWTRPAIALYVPLTDVIGLPRLTVAGALAAAAVLALVCRRAGGTTLQGPLLWAVAALVLIAVAAAAGTPATSEPGCLPGQAPSNVDARTTEALWFISATASLCPIVALLGAKRPQHAPWQFVVLTLWAILSAPAALGFLRSSDAIHLHPVSSWFLAVLLFLGPINYAATRFALPAALLAFAQAILLLPYLPVVARPALAWGGSAAVGLVVAAQVSAYVLWHLRRRPADPLAASWADFVTSYGVLWGLRVSMRVNLAAQRSGCPVRLTLSGFQSAADHPQAPAALDALDPKSRQALESSLRAHLRRFV